MGNAFPQFKSTILQYVSGSDHSLNKNFTDVIIPETGIQLQLKSSASTSSQEIALDESENIFVTFAEYNRKKENPSPLYSIRVNKPCITLGGESDGRQISLLHITNLGTSSVKIVNTPNRWSHTFRAIDRHMVYGKNIYSFLIGVDQGYFPDEWKYAEVEVHWNPPIISDLPKEIGIAWTEPMEIRADKVLKRSDCETAEEWQQNTLQYFSFMKLGEVRNGTLSGSNVMRMQKKCMPFEDHCMKTYYIVLVTKNGELLWASKYSGKLFPEIVAMLGMQETNIRITNLETPPELSISGSAIRLKKVAVSLKLIDPADSAYSTSIGTFDQTELFISSDQIYGANNDGTVSYYEFAFPLMQEGKMKPGYDYVPADDGILDIRWNNGKLHTEEYSHFNMEISPCAGPQPGYRIIPRDEFLKNNRMSIAGRAAWGADIYIEKYSDDEVNAVEHGETDIEGIAANIYLDILHHRTEHFFSHKLSFQEMLEKNMFIFFEDPLGRIVMYATKNIHFGGGCGGSTILRAPAN